MQLRTAGGAGMSDQPVEQPPPVTARKAGRNRDEVIHVEDPAPGEECPDAKAGNGVDAALLLEERELVTAFALLAPDALDEFALDEVGAEFRDDGKAAQDFSIALGEGGRVHDGDRRNARWKFAQGCGR